MRRLVSGSSVLLFVALAGCQSAGGPSGGNTLQARWEGRPATAFFDEHGGPVAEYVERGGLRYTWRSRYTLPDGGVRVCEVDLVADAAGKLTTITRAAAPRLRSGESPSCEAVLGVDA